MSPAGFTVACKMNAGRVGAGEQCATMKKGKATSESSSCRCTKCGAHDICSVETFRLHVERERDRADRSQRPFSLVIFHPGSDLHPDNEMERLIRLIQPRIRLADLAGWLSKSEVGVILVDTGYAGAGIFVRHLLSDWPQNIPRPLYRMYTYPFSSDPFDDRQLWFDSLGSVKANPQDAAILSRRFIPSPHAGTAPDASPELFVSSEEALHLILAVPPARWKRAVDVAVSLAALILLSPLLGLIVLLIKWSAPGPALYAQERVGFRGRIFHCLKFRSMYVDAPSQAHQGHMAGLIQSGTAMHKLDGKNDPRVFPVGRWLRASSLDELPQLINVLRGEMSLIGPRPCIPYEYDCYLPWHRHRVDALPGLTGLWQVSGKNKTTFAQMIRLDRSYARKTTLWLDVWILLRTLPVMTGQLMEDIQNRRTRVEKTGLKKRWQKALAASRAMAGVEAEPQHAHF